MKCVTGARVFPHAVQACPQVCPGADTPHLGPLEDQGGRLWLSGAPPGTPVCRPSAVICYVCQGLSARGREESCQSCACAHTRPFVLEPRVPSAAARSAREPPPWRAGLPRPPPPPAASRTLPAHSGHTCVMAPGCPSPSAPGVCFPTDIVTAPGPCRRAIYTGPRRHLRNKNNFIKLSKIEISFLKT